MNKKRLTWFIPVLSALAVIIFSAGYLIFKMGQNSSEAEKWKDYDDYGWS